MATVNVTITGERLAAAWDNELKLFLTPGDARPYWNAQASWRDDTCIADASDILDLISEDMGYAVDIDDLRQDEAEYQVAVAIDPTTDEDEAE